MKKEKGKVRNLIAVLSSLSFVAFLVVIGPVYYLGASGTFLLRNLLISSKTLGKMDKEVVKLFGVADDPS